MIKTKFTLLLLSCMCSSQLIDSRCGLAQVSEPAIHEQVSAVFKKRCVSCHGQSQPRGGLDMSTLDSILAGSNSGAVVQPGNPDGSLVYTLTSHRDTPKMPPNAPRIPQRELNTIATWISSLKDARDDAEAARMGSMVAASREFEAENGKASSRSPAELVEGLVPVAPLSGPLAITAVASSQSLVAVSGHHQVLVFDTADARWLGGLNFPEGDVLSLAFSADGKKLFAAGGIGGLSGSVVCWDTSTHQRQAAIAIEADAVLAMSVAPDGSRVAVGGPKRQIEVFELASGKRESLLVKHADWITSLAFSHDGVLLASGDRFGSIYLWDARTGSQFDSAASHGGAITGLQWSQDSNTLWSSGKDGFVHRWDARENKLVTRWQVSDKGVSNLLQHAGQIITTDNQRRLIVHDPQGQTLQTIELAEELTRCALLGSSSNQIIVGDFNSTLHHIDIPTKTVLRSSPLPAQFKPFVRIAHATRPVERQVQIDKPSAANEPSSAPDRASKLQEIRQALKSSRIMLEETRQNIEELEGKLLELEALIEE